MSNTARQLPTIIWKNTHYFIDMVLGQLRDVNNPHNFIDFNDLPYELAVAVNASYYTHERRSYVG